MVDKVQTVTIHGKEYVPVSERVRIAHREIEEMSITTEVLSAENIVLVKATVKTPKGTFTGMSAANPSKAIEKTNPYEVAETSAVGRALAFAGYGVIEGIASAEEIPQGKFLTVEELISKMETATSIYHLKRRWDKYQTDIEDLSGEDKVKVKMAKDKKKVLFDSEEKKGEKKNLYD